MNLSFQNTSLFPICDLYDSDGLQWSYSKSISEIFYRLSHFREALHVVNFAIYWSLSDLIL